MFYAATVHRETFRFLAQFLVDRIFVSPDSDRNETHNQNYNSHTFNSWSGQSALSSFSASLLFSSLQ